MRRFDPDQVAVFRYIGWEWSVDTGEVALRYGFDHDYAFTERIQLPGAGASLSPRREQAMRAVIRLLWLAAGISYYKAAAPPLVRVEAGGLTPAEREFLTDYYLHGLGEFAVVNDLDLRERPRWDAPDANPSPVTGLGLEHRPLVAVGGGKDSVVSVETLRRAGLDPIQFSVNRHPVIDAVMAVSGLVSVHARRHLDQQLLELNAAGALNGHIPVTAIVSLIALASALAVGVDTVVMSNERSASEGNLTWHGNVVNHQHSKSLEFERSLAQLVAQSVSPEVRWFSLLRPLSELHITKLFASLPAYHPVFTSCNRAFRIDPMKRTARWCGECDKCRFVSLALAPWLSREEVVAIIGVDLLDDLAHVDGFRALLGIDNEKPFECVGEIAESRAMLLLAASQPEWASAEVVSLLEGEVRGVGAPDDAMVAALLTPSEDHLIPAGFPRPERILG